MTLGYSKNGLIWLLINVYVFIGDFTDFYTFMNEMKNKLMFF